MREDKEIDDETPPDHERCVRNDGKRWRCKGRKLPGGRYCENHFRYYKLKINPIQESDFTKGQEVEVTSEEDGFRDGWFTAKILKLPNMNSNELKMVVQYKNLLAEERGKKHLKESVDPSFVRPVPPSQPPNQSFQLHQSVDAFHKDGWWKGQVIEILENSRYTVHFPASREKRKFGADKLRFHLDWVGGGWVEPQNKEGHQRKKDISQRSVKRKRQTNQWLQRPYVKFHKIIGEGSSSPTIAPKRTMSTRTRTPSRKARDALHQETGGSSQNETDIISSPSSRFSVHPAQNLGDPKSDVNLDGAEGALCKAQILFLQRCSDSQSRECNKESLGGDVINQQKEGNPNKTIAISETREYDIFGFESTREDPQEKTPGREVTNVAQLECPLEGAELQIMSNTTDDASRSISTFSLPVNPQSMEVDANDSENRKRKTKRGRGRPSKKMYKEDTQGGSLTDSNRTMPDRTTTGLEPFTILEGQQALLQQKKDTSRDSSDIFLTPSERLSDHPTPTSSNPLSFVDSRFSHGAQDNEINQQDGGVETTRESEVMLLESSADFIYKAPCGEVVAMPTECPLKGSEIENLSNIEDVPALSMCSTESFPPANAGDLLLNQVTSQSNMAITLAESSLNGEVISEDGKILFRKTYPVWQTFETNEIFRLMPQSPHFKPLGELHGHFREGRAVGYMLSYVDLVESTSKAQLDESDGSISEKMEVLEELEAVGFDVRAMRDRLEKLRRVKSVVVQLAAKIKQVETNIIKEKLEQECQKSVAEETSVKIRKIQESIIEMEKRREMLMQEKLVKDSNIIKFQKNLQKIEEKKHQVNLHFNRVAAAPW